MSKKTVFYIDKNNKDIVFNRKRHKLLYALLCPVTERPVLLIFKKNKKLSDYLTSDYEDASNSLYSNSGGVEGVVFFKNDRRSYCKHKNKEIFLTYHFGLKDDALARAVYEKTSGFGKKKGLEAFMEKLLSGKAEGFYIGRELVSGRDAIIAHLDKFD